MYGDLQFTNGTYKWKGRSKVFKYRSHPKTYPHCRFIVGYSGRADNVALADHWYANPDNVLKPRIRGELYGLVLTEDGDLYRFDTLGIWLPINEPFAAIGSGLEFAVGAMEAGASPKEAIKAAMKRDVYTGLGIKGYSFNTY